MFGIYFVLIGGECVMCYWLNLLDFWEKKDNF